jgi:hypothetical protein
MKNIFEKSVFDEVVSRIKTLNATSQPLWGKMDVAQMLAHCCVTYDMIYSTKYPKARGIKKFILKTLVKGVVVGEKPYKKNSRTAPEFLIAERRAFEDERERLLANMERVFNEGAGAFEGRESHSFGSLSASEWNNMFYKHLDHHLKQFGV